MVQTRRLTDTETTSSIVLYFSLFCALGGLLTLPFGWIVPSLPQLGALVGLGVFGGLSHILLTESYRYAPASLVAPLDYTALLWAFIIGYWFFGELPTATVYVGSAIVAGSGLFVIWRERQLGLERARARADAAPDGDVTPTSGTSSGRRDDALGPSRKPAHRFRASSNACGACVHGVSWRPSRGDAPQDATGPTTRTP